MTQAGLLDAPGSNKPRSMDPRAPRTIAESSKPPDGMNSGTELVLASNSNSTGAKRKFELDEDDLERTARADKVRARKAIEDEKVSYICLKGSLANYHILYVLTLCLITGKQKSTPLLLVTILDAGCTRHQPRPSKEQKQSTPYLPSIQTRSPASFHSPQADNHRVLRGSRSDHTRKAQVLSLMPQGALQRVGGGYGKGLRSCPVPEMPPAVSHPVRQEEDEKGERRRRPRGRWCHHQLLHV